MKFDGIILNGTSSSGKSSIARYLIKNLQMPIVYMSIDVFLEMVDFRYIDCLETDGITSNCEKLILGYQRSALAMNAENNFVLMDHVLQENSWKQHLNGLGVLDRFLKVGVYCDLEVAEAREVARGDRPLGLCRLQHSKVHSGLKYDIVVDTSATESTEAGEIVLTEILKAMERN